VQPAVSDLLDARFRSLWRVALADRDEDERRLRRFFVTGQDGPPLTGRTGI
jgi:hypothetical protein